MLTCLSERMAQVGNHQKQHADTYCRMDKWGMKQRAGNVKLFAEYSAHHAVAARLNGRTTKMMSLPSKGERYLASDNG